MKTTIKHTALSLFLALGFTATAQESTAPKDFAFPENTEMALEIKGTYDAEKHTFTQTNAKEYRFNGNGQLVQLKEMFTAKIGSQDTYHYDEKGELVKVDYLVGTAEGPISVSSTYTTEKESYKTTYIRKDQNGDMLRTIAFFNEAGELRGKSIYNVHGKRTQQIEYNGKEGYRIRKYHNDELMSEITHFNHDGKLTKTVTNVMPGGADEVKVMTLYYYNPKGDLRQMVDFVTETKNSAQKLTKTTYVDYLYDGDIWVAKIEYGTATKNPGKIVATIRTIETSKKTYHAPSEEQLKTFCQETYQKYLKL